MLPLFSSNTTKYVLWVLILRLNSPLRNILKLIPEASFSRYGYVLCDALEHRLKLDDYWTFQPDSYPNLYQNDLILQKIWIFTFCNGKTGTYIKTGPHPCFFVQNKTWRFSKRIKNDNYNVWRKSTSQHFDLGAVISSLLKTPLPPLPHPLTLLIVQACRLHWLYWRRLEGEGEGEFFTLALLLLMCQ